MSATARVFPTGVGMNRAQKGAKNSLKRVPHGCGDEPWKTLQLPPFAGRSLRVWG